MAGPKETHSFKIEVLRKRISPDALNDISAALSEDNDATATLPSSYSLRDLDITTQIFPNLRRKGLEFVTSQTRRMFNGYGIRTASHWDRLKCLWGIYDVVVFGQSIIRLTTQLEGEADGPLVMVAPWYAKEAVMGFVDSLGPYHSEGPLRQYDWKTKDTELQAVAYGLRYTQGRNPAPHPIDPAVLQAALHRAVLPDDDDDVVDEEAAANAQAVVTDALAAGGLMSVVEDMQRIAIHVIFCSPHNEPLDTMINMSNSAFMCCITKRGIHCLCPDLTFDKKALVVFNPGFPGSLDGLKDVPAAALDDETAWLAVRGFNVQYAFSVRASGCKPWACPAAAWAVVYKGVLFSFWHHPDGYADGALAAKLLRKQRALALSMERVCLAEHRKNSRGVYKTGSRVLNMIFEPLEIPDFQIVNYEDQAYSYLLENIELKKDMATKEDELTSAKIKILELTAKLASNDANRMDVSDI